MKLDIVELSQVCLDQRMKNNISQLAIAKKSGISRATVWYFENEPHRSNLSLKNLNLLVGAYGFSIDINLVKTEEGNE